MNTCKNLVTTVFILGIFISWLGSTAHAQQGGRGAESTPPVPQPAGKPPELTTKVYPVADLVFTAPNYPFTGIDSPAARSTGGGIGGGGMGGGGFFSVPDGESSIRIAQNPGFGGGGGRMGGGMMGGAMPPGPQVNSTELDQLINTIAVSIDTFSWQERGGTGSIVAFSNRLIVTQTAEVHTKIEKLLAALRAPGKARSTVTVRAWWLRLNDADYRALTKGSPATSPPVVDAKQLAAMVAERAVDHGEATCFDGQTIHIISGRFRNAVSSVVPVVGQNELNEHGSDNRVELAATDSAETLRIIRDSLASNRAAIQIADAGTPAQTQRSVGYQPIISTHHSGAMLEFTPTRLPNSPDVVIDLRSIVTQWSEQPEKDIDFNVIPIDRITTVSQKLATTLKLPLKTPVLVGGLSFQPGAAAKGDYPQLYLVVEATDES